MRRVCACVGLYSSPCAIKKEGKVFHLGRLVLLVVLSSMSPTVGVRGGGGIGDTASCMLANVLIPD